MTDMSTRLWAGLFVLVVFVAGLAAGVVVIRLSPGPEAGFGRPGAPGRPGGPPPARMNERLIDRMAAVGMDLTPEQDRQLRTVFASRQGRLRDMNEEIRRLVETQQEQMNAEIAEILTPEQMAVFESEIVRMGRQPRGPRGSRGGRGGRGGRGRGLPRGGPGPPP